MNLPLLLKLLARLAPLFGAFMLPPAFVSFYDRDGIALAFLLPALALMAAGLILSFYCREVSDDLDTKTAVAFVSTAMLACSFLGAFPFLLSQSADRFVNGWFESISGFTGTGATIFSNVESLSRSLLLWRSITNWLGGIGIVVFLTAIAPILGTGSTQLFKAELSTPQTEKLLPRIEEAAAQLLALYFIFTVLLAFLLAQTGMGTFHAACHALSAISTGGFSTKNGGPASFNNPLVDTLLCVGMLVASVNFALHYRFLVRRRVDALFDTELKAFLLVLLAGTGLLALSLMQGPFAHLEEALHYAFFAAVSTVSSSGLPNGQQVAWPPAAHALLILLTVIGGMSGSTAGGLKCIRLVAAVKLIGLHFKRIFHPSAVLSIRINDHAIPEQIVEALWAVMAAYFLTFSVAFLFLTFEGLDMITAAWAAFSSLSNIAPGLGALEGSNSYALLRDDAKLVLSLCMLVGRLEFFSILVLLTPGFWRR